MAENTCISPLKKQDFRISIHYRFQPPSLYCMSSYRANTDFRKYCDRPSPIFCYSFKEAAYCKYWRVIYYMYIFPFSILRLYMLNLLFIVLSRRPLYTFVLVVEAFSFYSSSAGFQKLTRGWTSLIDKWQALDSFIWGR